MTDQINNAVILVVDDEAQIRRLLRVILESKGYKVFEAVTGEEGIIEAAQRRPDLVLLDLGLPDLPGIKVLRRLREWSEVPVIILSVQNQEEDKVAALDAGADDYMTKPFGSAELLARIRANLRHVQPSGAEALFSSGEIEVDLAARRVTKRGLEVKLTPIEYELLRLFVTNAGKVLTHKHLLTTVWGPKAGEQTHYLRVHMAHLRDKLEDFPAKPALLTTETGIGYRLVPHSP